MSSSIQPGDIAFDRATGLSLGVVESLYNHQGADLVVVVDTPHPDSHRTRHREFPVEQVFTRHHDQLPIVINDTWDHKAGHYDGGVLMGDYAADHQSLARLARRMADDGYSADDIAYAIEKPWKYRDVWRQVLDDDTFDQLVASFGGDLR